MFTQRIVVTQFMVTVLLMLVAAPVMACDTPVYRYAMYRWTPTPYEVYFFHEDFFEEKKYHPRDTQLHRALERAAADADLPANVALFPVNVFADQNLRGVPPDVRRLWDKQVDKSLPKYMIVSPRGSHVFTGGLTASDIPSFVASPTRARINHLLAEGRAGVFVLLTGKDEQANISAAKVLDELARDVAAGNVELYMGPKPNFGEPSPVHPRAKPLADPTVSAIKINADASEDSPEHQIGVVKLARNDPQERWLVEMLLTIESDLKDEEFEDQPMIFVAYGRARALPPYIGKGITRNNLLDVLDFITSACSCTVKEQNPGVDLLTRYDWDAAAEKLADRFGSEEGNEGFYAPDEFFPELLLGPGKPTAEPLDQATTETAHATVATELKNSSGEQLPGETQEHGFPADLRTTAPDSTEDQSHKVHESKSEVDAGDLEASIATATSREGDELQIAALSSDPAPPGNTTASGNVAPTDNSWMYTLAIGVGVGLFVLIGASFLLFKKR